MDATDLVIHDTTSSLHDHPKQQLPVLRRHEPQRAVTRRRTRLGTRLLATMMVPTLALTGAGLFDAVRRQTEALAAADLQAQVGRVDRALSQYVQLVTEKSSSQLVVMASTFGITAEDANRLLGIDMTARLDAARTTLDTSAAPDPATPLGQRMPELVALRDDIDAGRAEPVRVELLYGQCIDLAQQAWMHELDLLERMAFEADGSADVRQAASVLLLTTDAFVFGSNETASAAEMAIPGLATSATSRQDLALARSLHAQAATALEGLLTPRASAVWRDRVLADPDVGAFEGFVDELLARPASEEAPAITITGLATVFRAGLIRQDHLQEAVEAAQVDTIDFAQRLRSDARDDLVHQVMALVVLIVLTAAATAATARSIVVPLRRLARRAADVSTGQIDGEPLVPAGPFEVAVVTEAFNESVANLQAVTAEATALAAADFDHPALKTRVAGQIGEALQVSVARLARSMRDNEQLRQSLARKATHDALTGLPNRVLLLDRLEQAVARSERSQGNLGVVFIDIDHFKVVNDAIGHSTGDTLLVEVARRIRASVRPADTVARFGGDEFVVVLESLDGAAEASAICERLREALDTPFHISGAELVVTASQGVVIADRGESAEDLLRVADAAMYSAKEHGRARTEFADALTRGRATGRLQDEADMRRGLESGEFIVHYQPVVELADGTMVGAEALVRWQHPTRGLVAPDDFIPVAEETGLIKALGEQVLREALRQAAAWPAPRPGAAPLYIAVNVSSRQFLDPNLPKAVARAIADSGIDADRVHLELTESALMRDVDRSMSILHGIVGQGVHISIDDFGTGYSSLRYVQRMPIDAIKIDRSFVEPLTRGSRDASIVTTVIDLGRTLGIAIVAEGVETAEQLQELRRLGCTYGQGYFFDRPMPADDFARLVPAVEPVTPVA